MSPNVARTSQRVIRRNASAIFDAGMRANAARLMCPRLQFSHMRRPISPQGFGQYMSSGSRSPRIARERFQNPGSPFCFFPRTTSLITFRAQ
jgi:hypothetical protein